MNRSLATSLLSLVLLVPSTYGQEQPLSLERLKVNSDQLAAIIDAGNLVPIDRDELDRRRKQAQEAIAPPSTLISDRIAYTARFLKTGKLTGTLNATVATNSISQPNTLLLGKPRFNSFQLAKPTAWGITADGNAMVLVDPEQETLSGDWTLDGKQRVWGTELILHPLAALASELTLTLPAGHRLQSNAVIVNPPTDHQTETQWRVILDGNAPVRLNVVTSRRPLVAERARVEVNTTWTLRTDSTTFQSEYLLQCPIPIDEFSIQIPDGGTVESVSYGDGTVLPIELSRTDSGLLLWVKLPDKLQGASRPFIVSATTAPVAGKAWPVPSLAVVACRTAGGKALAATVHRVKHRLRIESPLELQQLDPAGHEQADSVFDLDGTQTISLTRIFANINATLRVSQAQRSRQYQVATRVEPESGVWKHKSILVSDTPLPGELRLSLPQDFTVQEVSVGADKTPCDFRIEGTADAPFVRAFLPPIGSSTLELIGHTRITPRTAIATVDGKLATHVLVVPADSLAQPLDSLPTILAGQLPTAILTKLPTNFLDADSVIIESKPGTAIELARQVPLVNETPEPVDQAGSDEEPTTRVLPVQLTSELRSGSATDTHTVSVLADNEPTLMFELHEDIGITEVKVNQRKTRFRRRQSSVVVPLDTTMSRNLVEIRYELAPTKPGSLRQTRSIPLPQFRAQGSLSWNLTLPSGTRLQGYGSQDAATTYSNPLLNTLGPLQTQTTPEVITDIMLPTVPESLQITTLQSDDVTNYAWIATTAALLVGMMIVRFSSPVWLCAFEAIIAVLCFVLPDPFGTICGGCLLGGLIALVLSNLVTRSGHPIAQPQGSQFTVSPSRVGTLVFAVGLSLGSITVAQDLAVETFKVFEVEGQKTVYVEKSLLDRLEASTTSPNSMLLLQQAHYTVKYADAGYSVHAIIKAIIPEPSTHATVSLPFADANVNECWVDGTSQVFRKQDEEIRFQIPPVDEDTNPNEPREVVLELDLFPAVVDNSITLTMPGATGSNCTVIAPETVDIQLNGAPAEPGRPYPVTDQIQITAGNPAENTGVPATAPTFQNKSAVEVGSGETSIVHSLIVTPGSEPLERLDLAFPPTHRFLSLTSSVPSREEIFAGTPTSYVGIEFAQPVIAPVELTLKLVETSTALGSERSIRLMPLVPGLTGDEVTIATAQGLNLDNIRTKPSNAPDSETVALVSTMGPTTFRIDAATRVQFSLSNPPATREVWLDQTVQIGAEEVDYSMEAELRIINGPVFAHTLTVPQDLQIDTIVVRENGVDRLARYQQAGNELLLLLEGRTSGVQDIQVQGRISRSIDSLTAIPAIKIADASTRESTLVIRKAPTLDVTLENRDGIPFVVRPDSASTDSLADGEATFQLLEYTQLPLIRTHPKQPEQVTAVCFLKQTADRSQPDYKWIYRVEGNRSEVLIDLNGGTLEPASDATTVLSGSDTRITFPDAGPRTFVVTFNGVPGSVPRIAWKTNVQTTTYLAIPLGFESIVTGATEVGDGTLPEWAIPEVTRGIRLFNCTDEDWNVESVPGAVASRPSGTPAAFVETTLWQDNDTTSGVTTVVPGPDGQQLLMNIPEAVSVTSVEVEDRLYKESADGGELRIPTIDVGYVTLRWTAPAKSGNLELPFPDLLNGEAFFAMPDASMNVGREATAATTLEYMAQRPGVLADVPVPAGHSNVASVFFRSPASYSPQVSANSAATAAPGIGTGFIAGLLVFCLSLTTQYVRTGVRAALILTSLGGLLVLTSIAPPTGYALLVTAPFVWWKVPHSV
jgi:hypothetical protein